MPWRCHFCNVWLAPIKISVVGITQYCPECYNKHYQKFEKWKRKHEDNCHPEFYIEFNGKRNEVKKDG